MRGHAMMVWVADYKLGTSPRGVSENWILGLLGERQKPWLRGLGCPHDLDRNPHGLDHVFLCDKPSGF